MIDRLNPGPGLADFWAEFKRPNKYRWPILAGSALLTASLMFLLTDHAVRLNWLVGGVLVLLAGVAITAMIAEHVRIRFGVLAVAIGITGVLLYQFTRERVRIPPPRPEVTYISTFEQGRTDAEIEASNLVNQKRQDRINAEQAKREEEVKDAYRALGRATGLDVDAMEREIARDRTQDKAGTAGKRAESPVAD
jgi:uncharacterized protein (UPF0335 family)